MDQPVGDRRRAPRRRTVEEHGITRARVRPGYDATLIDVCAAGALVECSYRLLPGTTVDLQLDITGDRVAVRGRVLRCAVAAVRPWTVVYRAAIGFERSLTWPGADDDKGLSEEGDNRWARTTQQAT